MRWRKRLCAAAQVPLQAEGVVSAKALRPRELFVLQDQKGQSDWSLMSRRESVF